jgi:hypothetical protein
MSKKLTPQKKDVNKTPNKSISSPEKTRSKSTIELK